MSCHLCEDSFGEILERLPIKSLIRFRSVSKSWCSRFSSHVLVRISTPQRVLIRHKVYHGYNKFTDVSRSCSEDPKRTKILGSCNEIVCLRDLIDDESYICVLNFSVRRTLTLPYYPSLGDSRTVPNVAYGFGFDPITFDYKIVGICYSIGIIHGSFIYSIKTDSWTEIASPSIPFNDVQSSACFLNGSLYWLVKCYVYKSSNEPQFFIMTFNLSTHVFGTISMRNQPHSWKKTQVTMYKGCLAVTCNMRNNTNLWVMEGKKYWSFIGGRLKLDQFEIVRVLQPKTNGDLSFNTYNNGLKLLEFGPFCCGKTIPWSETRKQKVIRLSLPGIPI